MIQEQYNNVIKQHKDRLHSDNLINALSLFLINIFGKNIHSRKNNNHQNFITVLVTSNYIYTLV